MTWKPPQQLNEKPRRPSSHEADEPPTDRIDNWDRINDHLQILNGIHTGIEISSSTHERPDGEIVKTRSFKAWWNWLRVKNHIFAALPVHPKTWKDGLLGSAASIVTVVSMFKIVYLYIAGASLMSEPLTAMAAGAGVSVLAVMTFLGRFVRK